jgi:predicted O-linked N-acetylglucosamine transferase (SPINDLY family)
MNLEKLSGRALARHSRGELRLARRLYLKILDAEPGNFPARHMLGLVRYQEGAAGEALIQIDAALELNPGVAEAWSNYGLVLTALERFSDALDAFNRAIALKPDYAEAFNNRAIVLTRLKREEEAVGDCQSALRLRPGFAEALNNQGNALRDLGRFEAALACYNRALALAPGLKEARGNRDALATQLAQPHLAEADRLREQGSYEAALAAYDRALALAPEHLAALNSRGCMLRALQRYDESLATYDRALAINPGHVPSLVNRGVAMWDLKRFAGAIADYDRALAIQPDHFEAHNNRGIALWSLKRHDEALAAFGRALEANPKFAHAQHNRGLILAELKRLDEALEAYDAAYLIDPNHKYNFEARAHAALHLCDWARTARTEAQLAPEVMKGGVVHPFILCGYTGDKALLLRGAKNFIRDRIAFPPAPLWQGKPYAHEKIRIAYLSADFHKHATAYLVAGLMESHDRSRFEVLGISFGVDDRSPMRARMVRSFDRFFDVRGMSDLEVARMLRDMEVDIAVDLKGYTTDQRPEIFSHRPAPVQVNYLGFPGSMGADFMDYVIADQIVAPFEDQPFYTEKLVHLPGSYQVNDSRREIAPVAPSRAEAGLPENGFVFCCFNYSYKITAPVFDIWMRLLARVPGSVLWLISCNPGTRARLSSEAEARGIDPGRLVFAPRRDLADHLARHRLADLFLDTLPYNAHTTTSDAMWAGLPVLTAKGESFAGRVAASLLTAAGLLELITENPTDYEALALKLAQDHGLLGRYRQRLAETRDSCALFDTDRFRRNIEAAYTKMWQRAEAGLPPESFSV